MKENKEEYNPEEPHRERAREYNKTYRLNHEDELREYNRKYRENNKEGLIAYGCAYRKTHKEDISKRRREKRSRRTPEEIAKEKAYQNNYRAMHRDESRANSRRYYHEHETELRVYAKTYNNEHKEEKQVYQRGYRENHLKEERDRYLKREYGITQEQFDEILRRQGNKCYLCGRPFESTKLMHPVVEHDHKTGVLRGAAHGKCNRIIGWVNEDPEILMRIAKIIEAEKGLNTTSVMGVN